MAFIEGNSERNGKKLDGFQSIIGKEFASGPPVRVDELYGLPGPLAKESARWEKEVLGRFLGVPIRSNVTNETIDGGQYCKKAYVLPATDETVEGSDKRVAVIFPAPVDGLHIVRLFGPKVSENPQEEVRTIENENYVNEFDSLFRQSPEPILIPEWVEEKNEMPNVSINKNMHLFPVKDRSIEIKKGTTNAVLAQALKTARHLKVSQIQTDEYTFKNILHPDNAAELEVLTRDWEEIKKEVNVTLDQEVFGERDNGEINPA